MSFVEVQHLQKIYPSQSGENTALSDVSFSIEKGRIFGIIGLSGAGKSTLVRCINLLEKPTDGHVIVDGKDLMALSERELRKVRQNIGMIFQHFNLLQQRNVLDNVCFPLEVAGVKKREARRRAMEYLEAVGLAEKAKAYPVQLSGGQQQRVAIARVLAAEPKLLLCDEATSALDPQTTGSILSLLREINRQYEITMIIITHEMRVIQETCHEVAVLEHGQIAEMGTVTEIFDHPKTEAARRLLYQ